VWREPRSFGCRKNGIEKELRDRADALRTFIRYSFEQGLISRERAPAELFAPETREAYLI